jgi:hypothetical protein
MTTLILFSVVLYLLALLRIIHKVKLAIFKVIYHPNVKQTPQKLNWTK